MGHVSEKIFCAFCRIPRRVYNKKRVDAVNAALAAAAAVVAMFALWQAFDGRVMLLFVVFLSAAEIFIQIRRRLSLTCPYCSFDPILYVRDPARAAAKVRKFLELQKDSPQFLLSGKNPLLTLPHRTVKPVKSQARPLPSKQI